MRVKYEIFDTRLFTDRPSLYIGYYIEMGTGTVVQFIKGGLFSKDKFLIADDKTKRFIKINVSDCIKINN